MSGKARPDRAYEIVQDVRRQRAQIFDRGQYATHVRLNHDTLDELLSLPGLTRYAVPGDRLYWMEGCEIVIDDQADRPIVEARIQSNGYLTTWTAEGDPISVVTDPGPNFGKRIEWHPWP